MSRVAWVSSIWGPSGYAAAARNHVLAAESAGIEVRPVDVHEFRDLAGRSPAAPDDVAPADAARLRALADREIPGAAVVQYPPCDPRGRDQVGPLLDMLPPGPKALSTMFETDRLPDRWVAAAGPFDRVLVPTRWGAEAFARSGIDPARLRVVPLCLDPRSYDPATPRLELPGDEGRRGGGRPFTFLSVFEWTWRKGWDLLLRAWAEEFAPDEPVRLALRTYQGGGVPGAAPRPIPAQIEALLAAIGRRPRDCAPIVLLGQKVPAAAMPALYRAGDTFVLPTRGEGWGLPFHEALLLGVPVIAPRWGAMAELLGDDRAGMVEIEGLEPVGDAQVRDNPTYEPDHLWCRPSLASLRAAMRAAYDRPAAARARAEKGRHDLARLYGPETVGATLARVAHELAAPPLRLTGAGRTLGSAPVPGPFGVPRRATRVTLMARGNVYSRPGGDTTVLRELMRGAAGRGIEVQLAAGRHADLGATDLVHVLNFFGPEPGFAAAALRRGIPWVVTPLYEDVRDWMRPAWAAVGPLAEGAPATSVRAAIADCRDIPAAYGPTRRQTLLARGASALLCSGNDEAMRLQQDFGPVRTRVVPFGTRTAAPATPGQRAVAASVVGHSRPYVLCVGRPESRKNQLGLLRAIEHTDLPIVLATSGVTGPYADLCVSVRPRGGLAVLPRLPDDTLRAVVACARVHALPGFYELPGLVSLDAAAAGTRVVAGVAGTLADYLDDGFVSCRPGDPDSITQAVLDAWHSPPPPGLAERARSFRWERFVDAVFEAWREALDQTRSPDAELQDIAAEDAELARLEESMAAALARRDFAAACAAGGRAVVLGGDEGGAWQALGLAAIQAGRPDLARPALAAAVALAPIPAPAVLLYLASLELRDGDLEAGEHTLTWLRTLHSPLDEATERVGHRLDTSLRVLGARRAPPLESVA